ncbi:MAG TPA: hypothetical protein VIE43_16385 [Thermoanaerobaculia bacterium]|nr:hypothetical protein [Thermoanaerobaculia bacterium]
MSIVVPRFKPGWIVITPGALVALVEAKEDPETLIYRHIRGDWGDVGPADWAENEYALRHGERLISVYHTRHGRELRVMTEPDRIASVVVALETERPTKGDPDAEDFRRG